MPTYPPKYPNDIPINSFFCYFPILPIHFKQEITQITIQSGRGEGKEGGEGRGWGKQGKYKKKFKEGRGKGNQAGEGEEDHAGGGETRKEESGKEREEEKVNDEERRPGTERKGKAREKERHKREQKEGRRGEEGGEGKRGERKENNTGLEIQDCLRRLPDRSKSNKEA